MSRATIVHLALLACLIVPVEGWGQSPDEVTPTREELDLINQGVAASDAGNYELAIELFQGALSFGELNGAYLNLGRAQQKAGMCFEADESFGKALVAPRVKGLDPKLVAGYVERFRAEMAESCPGRVRIECVPGDLTLSIEPVPASPVELRCGQAVFLPPGSYTIYGTGEGGNQSAAVEVVAVREASVRLELVPVAIVPIEVPEDPSSGRIVIGLRFQSIVGYASGPVYTEDDPDAPFDAYPTDGTQDELDGLQISKANQGLSAEVGYGGEDWAAGLGVWAQLPATSLAFGAFGRYRLVGLGPMELLGQGHLAWGDLLQTLGTDLDRFVAHTGPVLAGGGLMLAWPLGPVALTAGLDVTVGVPDLGVMGALQLGTELRL